MYLGRLGSNFWRKLFKWVSEHPFPARGLICGDKTTSYVMQLPVDKVSIRAGFCHSHSFPRPFCARMEARAPLRDDRTVSRSICRKERTPMMGEIHLGVLISTGCLTRLPTKFNLEGEDFPHRLGLQCYELYLTCQIVVHKGTILFLPL